LIKRAKLKKEHEKNMKKADDEKDKMTEVDKQNVQRLL